MSLILSKLFKTIGLICILFSLLLIWQRNNPKRLEFNLPSTSVKNQISDKKSFPVKITINDLKINLTIVPAKLNKTVWETTSEGVSWLINSPIPGGQGNSILYGHNWQNLLGNLYKAKINQEIEITYKDGSKKIFVIDSSAVVTPDNISILNQTRDERITLYTCTGFLDSKRFVVVAKMKKITASD